jgi:serine/threonine protein phosphatase 1
LRAALQQPESHYHRFWMQIGGLQTVESYGGSVDDIPKTHREFFESCRIHWETPTHLFVHANYEPKAEAGSWPRHLALWQHLQPPYPAPHVSGKTVVVGHTPQESGNVLNLGHLICLDTYCFGGGCLTAMDLETEEIWQADPDGSLCDKK